MKILYGINGTGQGHIIKSTAIIHELKKLGIDVDIVVSGTNYQVEIPYDIKYRYHGFSFEYTNNGAVDWYKTAINLNPIQFIKDIRLDVKSYDKVVTDFEPITAWACKLSKKECIGISHQYSFLSNKIPRPEKKNIIGEFVINKLAPVSNPIGLHFEKYDDFIKYPIIRGDVKVLSSSNGGYYTVYLPSYNISTIINELIKYPYKFEIFTKDVNCIMTHKNLKIYPNSKSQFINSFIGCKGIITSGGFETPSEALILKKRLMVIPIRGQYEQICNAEALKQMGVFVGSDLSDVSRFFDNGKIIRYNWKDPINTIIESII